jgi:type II secretory pathway component GspD/PulD (secretin)
MVLLLAATFVAAQEPQSAPANANPASMQAPNTPVTPDRKPAPPPASSKNARRAAKLFLSAAKLYEAAQFEPAMKQYQEAAALDPSNQDYAAAVELARSHAVSALIQAAAKDRALTNPDAAHTALAHALELDPNNASVAERLRQVADDAISENAPREPARLRYELAAPVDLEPKSGTQSFHLRVGAQQLIQQVYTAYGIDAAIDSNVPATPVRFDLDDAGFAEAAYALALATNSFAEPLDPHHVIVAPNTPQMRTQYQRNAYETISLIGLAGASSNNSSNEMNDIQAIAKNIFDIQRMNLDTGAATLSLRAAPSTLAAFNNTWSSISEGRPEVLIDVKVIQLAHSYERNIGVQTPQQLGVFNVLAEAQSILQANQALVQQIIAAGLASPNDIATILAILLASGQVSNSPFNNGFAIFGGNCSFTSGTCSPTAFGLSPGSTTLNAIVNSSDSRELDNYQFRLQDGDEGTLKSGMRYPITTSTVTSSLPGSLNIPGLSAAGASGALSGILSQLGSVPTIPQIQYEDLGLTFKATARILRSGDVALSVDMKIVSLGTTSIDGNPVLNNRSYVGTAIVGAGEAAVVASEIDKSEVRAISGAPGLSEIPGLNNVTDKDTQESDDSVLIVMTPHVVRFPYGNYSTPMQILQRTAQVH